MRDRAAALPLPARGERAGVRGQNTRSAAAGVEEEFEVARGTPDRAFDGADEPPIRLSLDPAGNALANPPMNDRVADDAAFADLAGSSLELRLDQCDQCGALCPDLPKVL